MISIALVALHIGESPEAVPLGAGCVLAALRADPFLAGRVKSYLIEDFVASPAAGIARTILDHGAEAVGFSLFAWNRRKAAEACAILRAAKPGIVLFAGGPEATADTESLVKEAVYDFLVSGEGETATVEAVRALVARQSPMPPVFRGTPEKVESLVSPWLSHALNIRAYDGVLWELSRGCPFRCAYCFEGKGEKGVRNFPIARIKDELDLFAATGVKQIFVLDPTFNADRARAVELLRLFSSRGGGIYWKFEVRAELLDREQAKLFGTLDCSLQIGLQSAHPEVLRHINRTVDRGEFARKLALLDNSGVVFGLDLIYGLPGDTLEGFRESLDYALGLAPNHLDIFPLAVLPGTELADKAEAFGIHAGAEPPRLVVSLPGFPESDLKAAAALARACDAFYSSGRAVGWFRQAVKALRMRPSALLAEFSRSIEPLEPEFLSPVRIETLQIDFLIRIFEARGKAALLPALLDLVRFNAAWGRALSEGLSSNLELSYDSDEVLGPAALDLAWFVKNIERRRSLITVTPGRDGPVILKRGDRSGGWSGGPDHSQSRRRR